MKRYLIMWLLLIPVLFALFWGLSYLEQWDVANIYLLWGATALSAILTANEMRRPCFREYNRKKALFPKIPDKYLSKEPPTGGIIFGKDHHTGKYVAEENSHVLICAVPDLVRPQLVSYHPS